VAARDAALAALLYASLEEMKDKQQILRNKVGRLFLVDPTFPLETCCAEALSNEPGEQKLLGVCLACFPSAKIANTTEPVVTELSGVSASLLFKLCSKKSQALVGAVREIVGLLDMGRSLDQAFFEADDFMRMVGARVAMLLRTTVKKGSASAILIGDAAYKHLFETLAPKMKDATATFGDIKPLSIFSWLATPEQRKQVNAAVTRHSQARLRRRR
jgi:hypothetical protein